MTIHISQIKVPVDGGIYLEADLYVPQVLHQQPLPAISMANGYAGARKHNIDKYAEAFAKAGFIVLLHDHRNFGGSEGSVRHDIDPWQQIADWRRVLTYLEQEVPNTDPSRLGIWGTSYAGGHVLVLAATDQRVKCVVSQIPTISGYEQMLRRVPVDQWEAFMERLDQDERDELKTGKPTYQAIVSVDPTVPASYRGQVAYDFYMRHNDDPAYWKNEVTVRSTRKAMMYEPGPWVPRIGPTPLLMLVATKDTLTLTDVELKAYNQAHHPKKLVLFDGGHFDPYVKWFDKTSSQAIQWFQQYLGN
ncbi:hypothetical protein DFQ28_009986 [Apophysomyces sp. BC1034]|nr:hypothetical protein DFQ30_009650 [Apophysomyces sp. BC1015]KAG0173943.1 hypothetical protein DFQ29_007668 [Apophysomyces sp. BC1021]KAG0185066.1 hypothetical protein DFQ28_009986 [Apophysomyces sp. BC1034]